MAGSCYNRDTDELQGVCAKPYNFPNIVFLWLISLIEIIVLNVGLAAGILDTVRLLANHFEFLLTLSKRVFSMFVLEALVLTFMTTPVVVKLYPPKYRKRAVATGANFKGVDESAAKDRNLASPPFPDQDGWKTRLTVVLDKIEHLPGIMTVTQLFRPFYLESHKTGELGTSGGIPSSVTVSSAQMPTALPIIDALRLIELSDRTSAVMKSSVSDSLIHTDPLLNVFRTFSELNDVPVSASLSVVPFDELADKVAEHSKEKFSQLVLVPWLPPTVPVTHGGHGVGSDLFSRFPTTPKTTSIHSVDGYFNFGVPEGTSSVVHSEFVRGIFARSSVDVALFVDGGRGGGGAGNYANQHICLPFFGGPDDRLALSIVVQLCGNPRTTAKVFRVTKDSIPGIPDVTETGKLSEEILPEVLRDNTLNVNSVCYTHTQCFIRL